jgi:hypothetical protein
MTSFREFLFEQEQTEEEKDIQRTISKLPPSHRRLIKGYTFKFHSGNTLDGDDEHIGYMDAKPKVIAVASPWNYGREFTILHEIGHRVWDHLVNDDQKKLWIKIVKNTKNKQKQSADELFCMAYANHYAKNKIVIHDHPEWNQFIDGISKQ